MLYRVMVCDVPRPSSLAEFILLSLPIHSHTPTVHHDFKLGKQLNSAGR